MVSSTAAAPTSNLTHPHIVDYPSVVTALNRGGAAPPQTVPVCIVTALNRGGAAPPQTVPVCIVTALNRVARLLLRPSRSASSPHSRPGRTLSLNGLAVKLHISP